MHGLCHPAAGDSKLAKVGAGRAGGHRVPPTQPRPCSGTGFESRGEKEDLGYDPSAKWHGGGLRPPQATEQLLKLVGSPRMFVSPFCCS